MLAKLQLIAGKALQARKQGSGGPERPGASFSRPCLWEPHRRTFSLGPQMCPHTSELESPKWSFHVGCFFSASHTDIFLSVSPAPAAETSRGLTQTRYKSLLSLLSRNNAPKSKNKSQHCWQAGKSHLETSRTHGYKTTLLISTVHTWTGGLRHYECLLIQ